MNTYFQIRHILGNGSLYFPPFQGESFRQDVHWATYRCIAVNTVGTIVSRDVFVKSGKFIQFSNVCIDTIFCFCFRMYFKV